LKLEHYILTSLCYKIVFGIVSISKHDVFKTTSTRDRQYKRRTHVVSQGYSVAGSLEVLRVSYIIAFPTGGANDAQNVSVDTTRWKDNDQQNLFLK